MASMAIWWIGIVLEAMLLFRGIKEKLIRVYPLFYSYLLLVFVVEFLRFFAYRAGNQIYYNVYWSTQFLSLAIGSALIFEIYKIGLRHFPGTARMARASLFVVFAFLVLETFASPAGGVFNWFHQQSESMELSLRAVQGAALLVLTLLCVWYAVPFRKNLKGIVLGYGIFISLSIVHLTAESHFWGYVKLAWSYLQPCSYLLVLVIWVEALWRADEESRMVTPTRPGSDDYDQLSASTQDLLKEAGTRLGSAVRP